jgi:integrase
VIGCVLIGIGVAGLIDSFARFALQGLGTPAPVAPPEKLVSLRNYAMVLLMARLGLRPPEVVAMQIDDIDWRSGEILVRGKGDRHDRLPLLPEVGKALADYIKLERVTTYRSLFVISRPSHRPFKERRPFRAADEHRRGRWRRESREPCSDGRRVDRQY